MSKKCSVAPSISSQSVSKGFGFQEMFQGPLFHFLTVYCQTWRQKKKYSKKCSGGFVSCHGKMHGFHWKMHGFHWNMHGFHWNMHGFHGKMHGFHGKMHGFHGKMHGFHVKMHGLHGKIHGFHNMSNFWVTIFVFPLSKWASSL